MMQLTKHQTPNTNWQLTKFLTVFVMLFLFVTSCEYDDGLEISQTEATQSLFKVKTVKLEEIPNIKDYLNSKTNNIFYKESTNKDGAIFDTENIMEVIDTLNYANYSFKFVYPDTPVGTFYNLVVGKTPEGETKEPFVLKYVCDEVYLDEFITNDFNFQYFKGKVEIHKYTDFFEEGNFYKGDPYGGDTSSGGDTSGDDTSDGDTSDGDTSDDTGSGSGTDNDTSSGGTSGTYDLSSCTRWEGSTLILWGDCLKYLDVDQLNKGDTTNDCPDCPKPDGGIGINTTAIDINTILGDILNIDQLLWLSTNTEEETAIKQFLEVNTGKEANEFVELAINTWIDNSEFSLSNFNSFSQFIPDYKAQMAQQEIQIFDTMSKTLQTRYLYNAYIASNKAKELFSGVQRNTKADAFRHSYFHSLNTHFLGYNLSVQLGDAHETNTPISLVLEKTMDLYNNEVGRQKALSPAIQMNAVGTLLVRINDAIQDGDLVHLSPLNPDGTINLNTLLIVTN